MSRDFAICLLSGMGIMAVMLIIQAAFEHWCANPRRNPFQRDSDSQRESNRVRREILSKILRRMK